jgi:hypothetical protein
LYLLMTYAGGDVQFLLRDEAETKGSITNPSLLDKEVVYAVVVDAVLSMAQRPWVIRQLCSLW